MGKQQVEDLPTFDEFVDEDGVSLLDQLEIEKPEDKPEEKTPEEIAAAEAIAKEAEEKEAAEAAEAKEKEEAEAAAKLKEEEEAEAKRLANLEDDDPERIKAEKKAAKDAEKKAKEKEEDDEATFWGDVEKLTGREVEVDYGEVDPETPEGAALREDEVAQHAINDQLNYLSRMYPKEFRALEHAANGGSIDDLYTPGEPDYSKVVIGEDDEEYQKAFLQKYYVKKGFSDARAKRMVEADQDAEEGLFKSSTDALKELSANQEKDQAGKIEEQKRVNQQNKQQDLQMVGSVETVVSGGKLGNFTIPTKEREEFYQFALSRMQRNPNGGYMFVTEVNPNQLEAQLKGMFFNYKEGDLSTIIQREIKSNGARKLKRNISKEKSKSSGGAANPNPRKTDKLPTMEEFEE